MVERSCGWLLAAAVFLLPGNGPAVAQERPAPRIIAPELVAPPPVDPSRLERIAPRAPLSGLGRAGPPKEEEPDTLFFRPVATAAGVLEAEGRTITIAGIRVVPADRLCDAADGGTWPCGMRARTAFRTWLRGRAVDCPPSEEGASPDMPLKCSVAGNDVGAWLVENGWALAASGGPYEAEAKAARRAEKGIFGGGPARSLPVFREGTGPAPVVGRDAEPSLLTPQALP